jgi:hypothetical protein
MAFLHRTSKIWAEVRETTIMHHTLILRLLHSPHPVLDLLCGRRLYSLGSSCDIQICSGGVWARAGAYAEVQKDQKNEERRTKNEERGTQNGKVRGTA